jgi:hypothetical protein
MPGNTTNGLPLVGAPIQNGVTLAAPNGLYPMLSSLSLIADDTENTGGSTPQSVAAAAAQIAMIACAMSINHQTSTVHAATSNTFSGSITTEALTTAAGAVYTFTLTNSLIAAAPGAGVFSNIIFDIRSGTNTVGGMVPTSSTAGAGSTVLTFTNTGTAALNGTMVIAWHLAP